MTATTTKPPLRRRIGEGYQAFRRSVFWGALRRQLGWLIASIVFGVTTLAITIISTQAVTAIVDQAIIDKSRALEPLVIRLVVLAFIGLGTGFAGAQVRERIAYQLELDLRNLLYLRLQRAEPRELDEYGTGQVVTRAISDLYLLEIFIRIVSGVVTYLPLLLGFTIFLFVSNPILTIVSTSTFVINGFIINKVRHRLWGLSYLGLDNQAKVTAAFDEPVRGIRVVKAFARECEAREHLAAMSADAYRFQMTRVRLEARYDLILRAAPFVTRGLLLILGARFVVSGSLTMGEFLIFFTYTQIGATIATFMDEAVSFFQYLKTGAGRITELLRVGKRQTAVWEDLPGPSSGLELVRVGVRFGAATAVSNVSLTIAPGTMTVVSGPPGSGKSTVAALASGTLAATEGSVLLDGVDISRIDPEQVRRSVRLVSEEPFLFARTIRDNLTIGALAADLDAPAGSARVTDEALMAAIHAAAAVDIVEELAGGLDAVLGDRGLTLSGGQRQRLALARALVIPPRVLVLDDAMSAVTPALEADILGRIREHAPDAAILCTTRRSGPETIADAVIELPEQADRTTIQTATAMGGPNMSSDVDGLAAPGAVASAIERPPYDPRLTPILARLQLGNETPDVSDALAESEEPPTITSITRPFMRYIVLAMVFVVVYNLLGLIPEYVFGEAEQYIDDKNTRATDLLGLGIMAVAAGIGLFTYLFRITKSKAQNRVVYMLRRRMFARLTRLGIDYYDKEMPGQVSARVVGDISTVDRLFGIGSATEGVYDLLAQGLRVVFAIGIMIFLSPPVGLIALGFFVVCAVVTAIWLPVAERAYMVRRVTFGNTIERLQEDHAGRSVIKAFGAERPARLEFATVARTHREAQKRSETLGNLYGEFLDFAAKIAGALVLLRAGNLALREVIATGTVLSLRLYLDEARRPFESQLGGFAGIWRAWMRARVALAKLREPFEAPVLPRLRPDARPCPELDGAITFDGVTFGYPSTSRSVLHDLSFEVVPGDRVAIVGPTGAGKSSIAKLLGRIYDPDAGRVLVDGVDIKEYELTSYRARIGVVPQEAFLFSGTVAGNIAYGRPDAPREEIEAAVRAVGAYEVLSELDGGLDAPVTEEGHNLTAAERQLVALARAVLVRPDILVLDEATASLDLDTEARVLDAVFSLGLTTVLVTHRMATAERADLVIVIDQGQIVEAGTHGDLVTTGGEYAALWGYALSTGPHDAAARRRRSRAKADVAPARPPRKKAAAKKKAAMSKKAAVPKQGAVTKKASSGRGA